MLDQARSVDEDFARDVREGLSRKQKRIPSRWLYDERGSALFEQITELPEYYLTRTETKILKARAAEIAERAGPGATVIEYGAGALVKTRILLGALEDVAAYAPVDVSGDYLGDGAKALRADHPRLEVTPVVADFLDQIDFSSVSFGGGPVLGFFPGSTVGNLSDAEITDFFSRARADLGEGAWFVLGADLRKDPEVIIAAYDDAAGVTAEFNLNLLRRINRELDGDFELDHFAHAAVWNDAESQIEMHLVSDGRQAVTVNDVRYEFDAGETIHTENSRKFSFEALEQLASRSGWSVDELWTDPETLFGVLMLRTR